MIRLSEEDYRSLSSHPDTLRQVTLPNRRPRKGDGWVAAGKCPVIQGHAYKTKATLRETDGTLDEKDELVVTVMGPPEKTKEGWRVLLLGGDRSDPVRLLAKGGGDLDPNDETGKGSGYTASSSRALGGSLDPGEAVPESVQREWSERAGERDQMTRMQRIEMARAGVDALWDGSRDEKRAARQMTHELDKLIEGEEKAA